MATELLIFGYVATLLAVLAGLSLYDEQRRRRFEPPSTRSWIQRFSSGSWMCPYSMPIVRQ